jgi:hypothetical protein
MAVTKKFITPWAIIDGQQMQVPIGLWASVFLSADEYSRYQLADIRQQELIQQAINDGKITVVQLNSFGTEIPTEDEFANDDGMSKKWRTPVGSKLVYNEQIGNDPEWGQFHLRYTQDSRLTFPEDYGAES